MGHSRLLGPHKGSKAPEPHITWAMTEVLDCLHVVSLPQLASYKDMSTYQYLVQIPGLRLTETH